LTLTGVIQRVLSKLGLNTEWTATVVLFIVAVVILVFVLLMCLFLVYALRKILGFIQHRIGPVRTGPQGLLQTPCDAVKLLTKEDVIPALADRWMFTIAPVVAFVPAYLVYVVIPFGRQMIPKDLSIGVVFVAAVSGIHIIGLLMAGWASNNKYSMLGAFRGAAQLVSYEIPMIICMMGPVLAAGTLSMQGLVLAQSGWWYGLWQPLGLAVFFTAAVIELNLVPFDFSEAESELVSGFNVEYSGMKFAFFFLAEFVNAFTVSAIIVTLFLGGWHVPFFWPWGGWFHTFLWFMLKSMILVFVLMWIRSTLPRIRIDQLVGFGWKVLVPLSLVQLVAVGAIVTFWGGFFRLT
jgi:NADH-quinone oxidoreductase subunit H